LANGKICYVEIAALDIKRSAAFYKEVFGWQIRQRDDGSTAFDDTVGEVSGGWVMSRKPMMEAGLLIYIMVDSVAATVDAVIANGGKLVATDRHGRAGNHCAIQRSGRKRNGPLSAAGVTEVVYENAIFWRMRLWGSSL
jgi:predicted enzyme related to lactoylglutathione lyase